MKCDSQKTSKDINLNAYEPCAPTLLRLLPQDLLRGALTLHRDNNSPILTA